MADAGVPETSAEWDERYAEGGQAQLWSGRPNGAFVAEVGSLPAGRALDVGCGEGADAIWLAGRGWEVTGIDISPVALERCAAAARTEGVVVGWVQGDLVVDDPPDGVYDLVSVQYPALRHTPDDRAIRSLFAAVAPGGTLVVVGHVLEPEFARSHGFELSDYVQPSDIAARLDDGWEVVTDEVRPRVAAPRRDTPHAGDGSPVPDARHTEDARHTQDPRHTQDIVLTIRRRR